MLLQILLCLFVHALLHQLQLGFHGLFQLFQLDDGLLAVVPAHQNALAVFQISRAALHPQRHALHLVFGALPAHGVVGIVHLHPESGVHQTLFQLRRRFQNAGLVLSDGQNDDLNGGDLGGQNQSVIIAVGHDHRADHPGRAAP